MEKAQASKSGSFITTSPVQTQTIAGDFAKTIKSPTILALHGELGSGKTTFVQGLAKALGITKRIISPTFVIVRSYKNFYHIDLYRVESKHDLEGLGIEEIISNPKNIVVIEWAEKMGALLPGKRIDIFFEYVDENKRKIMYARSN